MMCNRFNFIHASLVSAKKLNTHPLPVKNDHHSMNSCLLGCLINDYTCTLRGYLAKQKFFGTKNKFLYSQQESFSLRYTEEEIQ